MPLKKFINYFNINKFSTIIIIFFVSKLIIFKYFFQIHDNLTSYWQLSNLELLQNDLFNTIKYLHMQPPLWNLIIGSLLKTTSGNLELTSNIILIFHWIFSFMILLIIKYFCDELNVKNLPKNIIFIIFIFHPSIIFYENLPYYPHLVVFLFFLSSLNLYNFFKTNNYNYELYFYLIIVILIFLISAFIPLLLLTFFVLFRFVEYKKKQRNNNLLKKIFYFLPILLIAFIPYFKNYYIFGTFTKGTWSGLQLATTTTTIPNNIHFNKCGLGNTFGDYNIEKNIAIDEYFLKYDKDKNTLNHPSIIGNKSSRNNLGMITRSEWCLIKNLKLINENKIKWFKGRIIEFLMPHSQLAIDYDFIESPKGYEKIKHLKNSIYEYKILKRIKQLSVFLFMITVYIILTYKILSNKEKDYIRLFYLFILMLYAYIILISSLFGNQEGQRFMHYGFIIQILFFIELSKFKILKI